MFLFSTTAEKLAAEQKKLDAKREELDAKREELDAKREELEARGRLQEIEQLRKGAENAEKNVKQYAALSDASQKVIRIRKELNDALASEEKARAEYKRLLDVKELADKTLSAARGSRVLEPEELIPEPDELIPEPDELLPEPAGARFARFTRADVQGVFLELGEIVRYENTQISCETIFGEDAGKIQDDAMSAAEGLPVGGLPAKNTEFADYDGTILEGMPVDNLFNDFSTVTGLVGGYQRFFGSRKLFSEDSPKHLQAMLIIALCRKLVIKHPTFGFSLGDKCQINRIGRAEPFYIYRREDKKFYRVV